MRCSNHHLKEGERLRERRGEGGEDDLDLGGLREGVGGRNHFLGVSGHWGDSGVRGGSSSRSGDPRGISRRQKVGPHSGRWLNCNLLVLTRVVGGWIGCWRLKSYFEDEVRTS